MSKYPVYSLESAPAESKPVLHELQEAFGLVPNVAGVMAGSATLLAAFMGVFQKVHSGTFNEAQIQILLLTNAVTNRSAWPVAFHSALALKAGVSAADVAAIRARQLPAARDFAALSSLARAMIERRGHVGERDLKAFFEAGFAVEQALELITVSAASTMTNYAASLAQPALEAPFAAHAWSEPPNDG